MTTEDLLLPDLLVQDILAAPDIRKFINERAGYLALPDIVHLRGMVDRLATMDFNMASRLAEAVWELSENLGDDLSRAHAEAALGRVEYCLGHYSQSMVHYEKAVASMTRLGQQVEVAVLEKQQVGALMYLGKHKEAISLAARAARVLKAQGEKVQLAELETNIGNLHCYLLDQYRKALRYYERAKKIFIELQNETSLARVEHNIANALTNLDRIDEALGLYQRAAQTYRKHGMLILAGQAEYNIAYLLFRRGQYNEALKCYYQVRETQQALGDEVSVAWCNMDLAELYLQLSVFEESACLAAIARKSFLSFENAVKAALAQTIGGLAHAGLGYLDEARRELGEALEVFARNNSRVMVGLVHAYLADLELKAGNYQTATANAQQAERIFVAERLTVKAAFARFLLARLAHLTGDNKRSFALLDRAQRQAEHYGIMWLEYECHYLRGCLYQAGGERQKAQGQFARAIEMVRQTRSHLSADDLKSVFLRDKLDLFERAIELSLDGSLDQAFDYIEQAKSRTLAELLSHYLERELAEPLAKPELRGRFLLLLNELNWYSNAERGSRDEEPKRLHSPGYLKGKRQQCEVELAEIFRRIQIDNASYAELHHPSTVALPELQALLAPDETIIEYFSTHGRISAFVITQDSIATVRDLVSEAEIAELLEGFQFHIRKFVLDKSYISRYLPRLNENIKDYLAQLQARLIAPCEQRLQGRSLVVIPHGLLHYVPFHALYDGSRYLIERYAISYAPSFSVYALCCRKQAAGNGPMLLFGLPDKLAPAITSEIEQLANLDANARVLLGKDATIANLKRYGPTCRILHLATHGVIRPDNPLFSYLKMADGELTFYNTFELKLSAELVTLSACHTGKNSIFPGDELHGLMRGFLYSGTPSLLVSLWEADDQATSMLMASFYQRLFAGESKREALANVQRELLAHYQHPYYWASFVLMGKP